MRSRQTRRCTLAPDPNGPLPFITIVEEVRGLYTREQSAGEQCLALTAAGKALVPKLAALADANDAHFFGHLSAAKRQALAQAMQDLVQHHQLKELPTA